MLSFLNFWSKNCNLLLNRKEKWRSLKWQIYSCASMQKKVFHLDFWKQRLKRLLNIWMVLWKELQHLKVTRFIWFSTFKTIANIIIMLLVLKGLIVHIYHIILCNSLLRMNSQQSAWKYYILIIIITTLHSPKLWYNGM